MLTQITKHGCIYQDDVVDLLVKTNDDALLRENSDGNTVLSRSVLDKFKALKESNAVWVGPSAWRLRVAEDELSRKARG